MKLKKHIQNLWSNWIFNQVILKQLPNNTRNTLNGLRKSALFVALVDGLVFGLAMNATLGASFLLSMLSMSVVVIFLETFFLTAGAAPKWMRYARAGIALILVAGHSLLLDSWVLDKEIKNHFTEENKKEELEIDSLYQQKHMAIEAKIQGVRSQNDSLYAKEQKLNDQLFAEINVGSGTRQAGYGIYAKKFEELGSQQSLRNTPRIAKNDSLIKNLEGAQKQLLIEQKNAKSELIAPQARGLFERLEVVWILIFRNGNTHTIAMYMLMFVLMLAIELIPLLKRIKSDNAYRQYDEESNRQALVEHDNMLREQEIEQQTKRRLNDNQARHDLNKQTLMQQIEHDREIKNIEDEKSKQETQDELDRVIKAKTHTTRIETIQVNGLLDPKPKRGRPPKEE